MGQAPFFPQGPPGSEMKSPGGKYSPEAFHAEMKVSLGDYVSPDKVAFKLREQANSLQENTE